VNIGLPGQFASLIAVFWVFFIGLTILIHVLFALAVWQDGTGLVQHGSRLIFVGPAIWALATLLGGVFVAVAYWLVHYSTLRAGRLAIGAGPEPEVGIKEGPPGP